MIQLRNYQEAAIQGAYTHMRTRRDNGCIVIPTGGGKTPVMASICNDAVELWGGRVLILAHVKELLQQAVEKLQLMAPNLDVGVYSAGLNRRDTDHSVIVAGIQSVYKRACELGAFDIILIDEAHMIPPDGDGMYQTFLADAQVVNPNVRLIGLTATPYRTTSGEICGPENLLNHICYEVGVRELIVQGFLCPLKSKASKDKIDVSGVHVRGGEFIACELEALMDDSRLIEAACDEITVRMEDDARKSCLIFASGVRHAENIQRELLDRGERCGFVCGETSAAERAETLQQFRDGELTYLANVNVLTTGFDAPNIDCVAMLRPTLSPGLYYQMVGRGFRLHPSKKNCLVLDFGGNILRHGPVDALQIKPQNGKESNCAAPAKECPMCQSVIHAAYAVCPDCGYEFPPTSKPSHDQKASNASVLSGEITDTEYEVRDVEYSVHIKRDAKEGDPRTMRIKYLVAFGYWASEWVCPEHTGWARQKFEKWWSLRTTCPPPKTAQDAVALAEDGALAVPETIVVRTVSGEKYDRIHSCEIGEPLQYDPPPGWNDVVEESETAEPEFVAATFWDESDWDESEIPF